MTTSQLTATAPGLAGRLTRVTARSLPAPRVAPDDIGAASRPEPTLAERQRAFIQKSELLQTS